MTDVLITYISYHKKEWELWLYGVFYLVYIPPHQFISINKNLHLWRV